MARQTEGENPAAPHPSDMVAEPYLHRLTDAELAQAAEAPEPITGNPNILPLGFSRGPIVPPARGGAGAAGAGGPGGGRDAGGRGQRRARKPWRSRADGGWICGAELNKPSNDEGVLQGEHPSSGPGRRRTVMWRRGGWTHTTSTTNCRRLRCW